jgi:hypothetical protein
MGATLGINAMLEAHNVRPHGTFQADVEPKQHDFVTLRCSRDLAVWLSS